MHLPRYFLVLPLLLAACGQQPVVDESMLQVEGDLPADYSGSWQRNYARDDQVNAVLQRAYYDLARTSTDRNYPGPGLAGPSQRDADAVLALAKLAELITRSDVIRITQDSNEIRVEREDDFSLTCRFSNGKSQAFNNSAGAELCGWDDDNLVSLLTLADGLKIVNRFTISEDRDELRIVTTVNSPTSRVPITLRRFYRKFDRPASTFHCVETLSMNRVCSTREVAE